MIYFISGIVAGILESTGILDPGQHNTNTESITSIAGPLIILVSLALAFRHEKHKLQAVSGVPVTETSLNFQPIIDLLTRAGVLKQSTTQPQTPVSGV